LNFHNQTNKISNDDANGKSATRNELLIFGE